jgi:3-deoxy-7-phosphoheptulonate synthase
MASGLSMPVGFKNSTDGNLQIAVNAMESARHPHTFLGINQEGRTSVIHTEGNPDGHLILRGGRTPNYDAASVRASAELLAKTGLPNRVMVDCSHGQTSKDYTRQPLVLAELVNQLAGADSAIMGCMLESHLGAGNQPLKSGCEGLRYGVSITDACIDWSTTERALTEAAERLG